MPKIAEISPKYDLEHLAPCGRIGVIALATDFNIEQDLRRILPAEVEIFTNRVHNINPLTLENLRSMEPRISAAASAILPGTKLDALIYACTSGTVAIGIAQLNALVQISCPGIPPVINPISAALEAFSVLGARRLSILTPYTTGVNLGLAEVFENQGYEVLNVSGFGFEDDTIMTFISPEDIIEAAVEHFDQDADLLFISCTALRAAGVIEIIEDRIGKPVLTSNQLLAWHSLQRVNYPSPVEGYGRLMRREYALP